MAYAERNRIGYGRAQVLNIQPAPRERADPAAAKAAADAKKTQDKAFQDIMDTDFDYGWQIHDNYVQEQVDKFRNQVVGYKNSGGDVTSADFQRVAQAEMDQIGLLARASNDRKEAYDESYKIGASQTADERFNKTIYNERLLDLTKERDKDGNIIGPKKPFDMDTDEMLNLRNDSSTYNMNNVWREGIDSFEEVSHKAYKKKFRKFGSDTEVTEWSGKLLAYNEDGTPALTKDGLPKINIDAADPEDDAKLVLMQDEWINNYVTQQREAEVGEAEIWQEPIKMMQSAVGVKKSVTSKTDPQWMHEGSGVSYAKESGSIIRNWQLEDDKGNKANVNMYVPDEISVSSATKADRDIPVKVSNYVDMETGKVIRGEPGDSQVTITSIQAIPWAEGTSQIISNEALGKFPHTRSGGDTGSIDAFGAPRLGTQETLWGEQKKGEGGVKWFAQGTMTVKDEDGIEIEKKVLVPYEDVASELKTKTKFDLENMINENPAEFSDEALYSQFKANTNFTYDEIMGQISQIRKNAQ